MSYVLKDLEERYDKSNQEIIDRLNYELDVIEKMGYVEYFLNSLGLYKLLLKKMI